MPRFFFDFDDGQAHLTDDDGLIMKDVHEARGAAIAALPGVAKDLAVDRQYKIKSIVRDEEGRSVFQAELTLTTSCPLEQT